MGRTSDAKEKLIEAISELIWRGSYGATSVDHICERAGVKKGSFYHFFESKADLAVAAIDQVFLSKKAEYDTMFSPSRPPLERLNCWCDYSYKSQKDMQKECGCVLGCPLFTLGAEVSTAEQKLRSRIEEVLAANQKYLESTIRDAHAAGVIDAPDPAAKARMIMAYYEGVMTQARIANDAEVVRELASGIAALLGISNAALKEA